ncbi:MAG: PorT family protein [Prevotella sp.]|jgi:hypothetical protein|nr:PorT family protein [Prevotella sp.]
MKNLKAALILFSLLVSLCASAQEDKKVTFGVKIGSNLSNLTTDMKDTDEKTKAGGHIGVTLDYNIKDNWYILAGLNFTMLGAKEKVISENELNELTTELNYLQLPVHAAYKLKISETAKLVFHGGPYISYAVNGKHKSKATSGEESVNAFSDEAGILKLKKFDAGIGLGIGIDIKKFNIDLGSDLGIANIYAGRIENTDVKNVQINNTNAYISLGYKF